MSLFPLPPFALTKGDAPAFSRIPALQVFCIKVSSSSLGHWVTFLEFLGWLSWHVSTHRLPHTMGNRRWPEIWISFRKKAYPLQPYKTENMWAKQAWRHWNFLQTSMNVMKTMPLCVELWMCTKAGRLEALSGIVNWNLELKAREEKMKSREMQRREKENARTEQVA